MDFPLSLWDISLWIAVMAIITLVTAELLVPSDYFGDFVIDKTRLRIAALILGGAFMFTVILRVLTPQ
jgi:hypothetical protein